MSGSYESCEKTSLGPPLGSIQNGLLSYSPEISYEPRHEKTNILVSDLVRHKLGCTATEEG